MKKLITLLLLFPLIGFAQMTNDEFLYRKGKATNFYKNEKWNACIDELRKIENIAADSIWLNKMMANSYYRICRLEIAHLLYEVSERKVDSAIYYIGKIEQDTLLYGFLMQGNVCYEAANLYDRCVRNNEYRKGINKDICIKKVNYWCNKGLGYYNSYIDKRGIDGNLKNESKYGVTVGTINKYKYDVK